MPEPLHHGNQIRGRQRPTEWLFWKHGVDDDETQLPNYWFDLIPRDIDNPEDRGTHYRSRPTRREIEDCAARAFAQLSAKRRAKLLAGPTEARQKPARAKPKKKKPKGKKK